MTKKIWSKALRHGAYGVLLAGSALAALTPDWATTLKAQNYAGYVDLSVAVRVDAPTRQVALRAGTSTDILATIANGGPADAHRPRTIVGLQGPAVAGATDGCQEDPQGFPDCELSSPLPAGGSADYLMTLSLAPDARGSVGLAVAATSDDPEAYPGQELKQLTLPIEAHVDLRTAARCNRGYQPADKPLSCQATFRNDGQAAVLNPYFALYPGFGMLTITQCTAARQELCPVYAPEWWWNAAVIMPGEWLTVSFDTYAGMQMQVPVDELMLYAHAHSTASDEIEDAPADNDVLLLLPVPIFADGFDGDPPPLQ